MSGYAAMNQALDCAKAEVIVAGVDSGAVSSKALIMLDGEPYAFSRVRTRTPEDSAVNAINAALDQTPLKRENIHFIVATGRGRSQVPFAHETLTEIACAAAGAVRNLGPSVGTVLDAGGESCRVIHCTGKGRATSFLWNDKCAAGIGRYLEGFADLVGKDLSELGGISLGPETSPALSDFCPIYAQSEALDLLRSKVPLEQIIAAYHDAMAKRIGTLVARTGVKKELAIIGGLAKNPGITARLEGMLEVSPLSPKPDWDPTLTTALGAAVYANSLHRDRGPDL